MFCRQSEVAFFATRMKTPVAFVCVQFIITSFPSFHKAMKIFLHLPIPSEESPSVQGERKKQGLNSLDRLKYAVGNMNPFPTEEGKIKAGKLDFELDFFSVNCAERYVYTILKMLVILNFKCEDNFI